MTGEVRRILVAVADSPAGLEAARAAVVLAAALSAELRVVHVVSDGVLAEALGSAGPLGELAARRGSAADALLRHVAGLARRREVPVSTALHEGEVAPRVLDEARDWDADLVVLGRTTRHGAGDPFIGMPAQQVLEFSDRPVLVVPERRPPARG